jgi:hypothetical protein
MHTGLVPRFPTAILATGMMLLGFLCLASAMILDSVNHGLREAKRLAFLTLPLPFDHEQGTPLSMRDPDQEREGL